MLKFFHPKQRNPTNGYEYCLCCRNNSHSSVAGVCNELCSCFATKVIFVLYEEQVCSSRRPNSFRQSPICFCGCIQLLSYFLYFKQSRLQGVLIFTTTGTTCGTCSMFYYVYFLISVSLSLISLTTAVKHIAQIYYQCHHFDGETYWQAKDATDVQHTYARVYIHRLLYPTYSPIIFIFYCAFSTSIYRSHLATTESKRPRRQIENILEPEYTQ